MAELKKVIKGLEICTSRPCYCTDCPYKKECCLDSQNVMEDALALLKEQKQDRIEIAHEIVSNSILVYQGKEIVRCKYCKHGSIYMTEDVCGKTLIECNHPDIGDAIAIHAWDWFCADGERK